MHIRDFAVLGLLATLATAGCSSRSTAAKSVPESGDVPDAVSQDPPSASPEVGMLAPDITGVDTDGKPFSLSDYRGKVVMLDFWGNW